MAKKEFLSHEFYEMMNEFARLNGELEVSYEEMAEDMKRFTVRTNQLFLDLVKHGWYFNTSGTLGDMESLKKLIQQNKVSEINFLMSKQIKKDYKSLKIKVLEMFPEKREILGRAFKAHEKKQFEYSILLFLTQTDSICKSLTGCRLFGREQKQPKTKKFVDKHFDEFSFISGMLNPLAEYGVINKAEVDYVSGDIK